MRANNLLELVGYEVARKIATEYGGTRTRIPTQEELDLLEQRNREICELYYNENKSMLWLQNKYYISHDTVTKIINAAQP